jgi:hypothetical protein
MLPDISDQEHKRFVRGELSKIAEWTKWAVVWLAIAALSLLTIAGIFYRHFS